MDLGFHLAGGSGRGAGEPLSATSEQIERTNYAAAPTYARESDSLAAALFLSGGTQADLSHENGPTLYIEPNRTSAIDDIRSVVIYIFIITILFSFFLILPGIRNEKFPTFLCITTSLVVTSIVMIALMGTTWHVAEGPISAAYKAFSRDRIQGDLEVRIGLQSVNVSLIAQRYYFVHSSEGPVIYENSIQGGGSVSAEENEPKADENFKRKGRRSILMNPRGHTRGQPSQAPNSNKDNQQVPRSKYVIKRHKMDINYNERFHWIEPNQMRQEYHLALQRGLPYPILTVVEYLSQDEAGFNWSRQYRAAGYYTTINLWLSICLCILMFCLHCAVPKYGIYAMQTLGCLLLFTCLTYATLVPRGERALVIPFEGDTLRFRFGWNFWLVLVGGCLSLLVGTIIVIIDNLFPNFIFTTVLDAGFDSQLVQYHKKEKVLKRSPPGRPERPPAFIRRHRKEGKDDWPHRNNSVGTKEFKPGPNETTSKPQKRVRRVAVTSLDQPVVRATRRATSSDGKPLALEDRTNVDDFYSRL